MNYNDVNPIKTRCEAKNLKLESTKKISFKIYKFVFSLSFAVLLFANVISLTCIVSEKFKNSLISTFNNFNPTNALNSDDNYFYNILESGQFKTTYEFDIPISGDYKVIENAIVFSPNEESIVKSASSGQVLNIVGDKTKEVQIVSGEFIFHYINLNSVSINVNDKVGVGEEIGKLRINTKLYFYVTKLDFRLQIDIKNLKVVISEN